MKHVVVLTLLLSISFSVFKIRAEQSVFSIGVQDVAYYPLYDFHNKRDSFSLAVLEEFAIQTGIQFNFVALPIKRTDAWLKEEKVDFLFPDNPLFNTSKTWHEDIIYSIGVTELISGVITHRDHMNWREKQIRKVGILLGFTSALWSKEIASGDVELVRHSSSMVLVQQLLHKHIDALEIDSSVVANHLTQLGKEGNAKVNLNMRHMVYSLHLSTLKHSKIVDRFDKFLTKNQPFVKSLYDKYGLTEQHKMIQLVKQGKLLKQ